MQEKRRDDEAKKKQEGEKQEEAQQKRTQKEQLHAEIDLLLAQTCYNHNLNFGVFESREMTQDFAKLDPRYNTPNSERVRELVAREGSPDSDLERR